MIVNSSSSIAAFKLKPTFLAENLSLLLDKPWDNKVSMMEETEKKPDGIQYLRDKGQEFKNFHVQSIGDKAQEEGIITQNLGLG